MLKLFWIVQPANVFIKNFLHLFNLGFNVEMVEYKNISLTIWDVSSHWKIRPLWRHYSRDTQGKDYSVCLNVNVWSKTLCSALFRLSVIPSLPMAHLHFLGKFLFEKWSLLFLEKVLDFNALHRKLLLIQKWLENGSPDEFYFLVESYMCLRWSNSLWKIWIQ